MKTLARIVVAVFVVFLGGCASQTARDIGFDKLAVRKAEQALSNGIHQYEDGDLKAAQKNLNDALALGLTFNSDKATAYKYLAFIYCSTGMERQCKDEFRRAFEIDPGFKLEPTEMGHPLWGPVYNSVKHEMAGRTRKP